MMKGVELYKHFAEQVQKMGRLKRAWFTTFNFEIGFFEKYILSALTHESFRSVNGPRDYENFSQQLVTDGKGKEEDKLEVRVFYDFKVKSSERQPKKTSILLHPVDVSKITNNGKHSFAYGVFHPKVVLLENQKGEIWLMCSSANLTLSGWGKQREAFTLEKLEGTANANAVGAFFKRIGASVKDFGKHPLIKTLEGSYWPKNDKWRFHSSFSDTLFAEEIMDCTKLKVWSPYFSGDLKKLLTRLTDGDKKEVIIVPAKNENQKIRITKEEYKECSKLDGVQFHCDHPPEVQQDVFVHAKVWLTENKLALGSWNMTDSGMNTDRKATNNNIEAGIIYSITPSEYRTLRDNYKSKLLTNPDFQKQEELEEEKAELLEDYKCVVDILADWETGLYTIEDPDYNELLSVTGKGGYFMLPGLGKVPVSDFRKEVSFTQYHLDLVTDRIFDVFDEKGNRIFRSYIRECGLHLRPAYQFTTLEDYMSCWLTGYPEYQKEYQQVAGKQRDDDEEGIAEETHAILVAQSQNAWFTSFRAYAMIRNRLRKATAERAEKTRTTELLKIGRSLPGSLTELRKHLLELVNRYQEDKTKFRETKSEIYLWFLVEEANFLFEEYNKAIGNKKENLGPITNITLSVQQGQSAKASEFIEQIVLYIRGRKKTQLEDADQT